MTRSEIINHKDYNPNSFINKLWSEYDQVYYLIIETNNSFEIQSLKDLSILT